MTVSANSAVEFDVSTIVATAYQMAGLANEYQSITAQQAAKGQTLLELIASSTQTMGLFAKVMQFYDLPLAADTRSYTLPGTILDVDGDGAFIAIGQTLTAASGETPVRPISRERFHGLSAHDATGRPIEYFTDRTGEATVIYFWPTPDAASAGTVRLQTRRLRATMREGTATPDFEPFWQDYFVYELAARLALAAGVLARVKFLKDEAQGKLELCRAQSQQRGSQQFVMAHRSGSYR
ncbi:MAG TPA: hypothetical protein VN903_00725 [Polyangia bacterium]|nr:hypothetical protein [Polyangia bacterium]